VGPARLRLLGRTKCSALNKKREWNSGAADFRIQKSAPELDYSAFLRSTGHFSPCHIRFMRLSVFILLIFDLKS
jgi:hypothetical protein